MALASALTFEKVLAGRNRMTNGALPVLVAGPLAVFAATFIRPYALRNPYPGADMAALTSAVLRQTAPGATGSWWLRSAGMPTPFTAATLPR